MMDRLAVVGQTRSVVRWRWMVGDRNEGRLANPMPPLAAMAPKHELHAVRTALCLVSPDRHNCDSPQL